MIKRFLSALLAMAMLLSMAALGEAAEATESIFEGYVDFDATFMYGLEAEASELGENDYLRALAAIFMCMDVSFACEDEIVFDDIAFDDCSVAITDGYLVEVIIGYDADYLSIMYAPGQQTGSAWVFEDIGYVDSADVMEVWEKTDYAKIPTDVMAEVMMRVAELLKEE